ncbi:hypothetical protein K1W54_29290 [Micromonospora sp. CPCC 205371]|nr:hypothetical protein [Micromonospora sp. CPCC 205371]
MIELPVVESGFLGEWVDRLRTAAGPPVVGILLRGSYARAAATAYSDVDLDVVVTGPTYEAYPAYLAETGVGRLVHISIAMADAASWAAHVAAPADWAFGLPVRSPVRVLWAAGEWRERLDRTEIHQPPAPPELDGLVAGLGKVAGAFAAGDDLGGRLAGPDPAPRRPARVPPPHPPVPPPSRREALDAALSLPAAPPGYREAMLTCLGLTGGSPSDVYSAARRLVSGTVATVRPYAHELAESAGPDLGAALVDGRLDRYLAQLRPHRFT